MRTSPHHTTTYDELVTALRWAMPYAERAHEQSYPGETYPKDGYVADSVQDARTAIKCAAPPITPDSAGLTFYVMTRELMEDELRRCNDIMAADGRRLGELAARVACLEPVLRAADNIAGWFRCNMDKGAFSSSEHLLAGDANELMGDVEKLREVIVEAMKRSTAMTSADQACAEKARQGRYEIAVDGTPMCHGPGVSDWRYYAAQVENYRRINPSKQITVTITYHPLNHHEHT